MDNIKNKQLSGSPDQTYHDIGYCAHGPRDWQPHKTGPLAGRGLAVKDLFSLAGHRNTAGNPDWHQSHPPSTTTAAALAKLLEAGAIFRGFSHTDELAYSLEGNNHHYQATENPKMPGHACGGSTMGSAAAVASGHADIGLGTDTAGSIRVPASYCGLFGLRPSHGAISTQGLIGLAPRFDTVAWLARDAQLLAQVNQVLNPTRVTSMAKKIWLVPALVDLVDSSLQPAMQQAYETVRSFFPQTLETPFFLFNDMAELAEAFRVLQARAIINYHGDWLEKTKPYLSAPVAQRIAVASKISDAQVIEAEKLRLHFTKVLNKSLASDCVLFLPTTPTTAPKLAADTSQLRPKLLQLTCLASLSGTPQIHLPLLPQTQANGVTAPYGFSLLQAPNKDHSLLAMASHIAQNWPLERTS